MPTPVPPELLPKGLRTPRGNAVPTDLLPEGLRPEKEAAGFFGSLIESAKQLPEIADEVTAFGANPTDANRRALIAAGESKYRQVGFGEGENWEAFKQLLGSSLGQLAAPAAAGLAATPFTSPIGGLITATGVSGTQYTAQNLLRQAQEQERAIQEGRTPEEASVGKALLAATGQTALDLAGGKVFKTVAGAFPFMRPLVGQAGKKAATEAGEILADAASKGTISFAGGVAKGVGKGIAFELPQEVAQSGLERWQAGLSLTDEEAQGEYGQAAIGAVLLGGGFGAVEGGLATRRAMAAEEEVAPEAEPAAPELNVPEVTPTPREDVLAQLRTAAGSELSTGADAAVKALERRVSNDLSLGTPESLAASRKYITEQEDRIAAGELPEDIAEPFTNALAAAKGLVGEAAPVKPVETAAPTRAVWASQDYDIPVEVVGDEVATTPDGRKFRSVRTEDGKDTYVPEDELRFEETTSAPLGEPAAPISAGVGEGVLPAGEPKLAGAATPELGATEPGPVGVSDVPPSAAPESEVTKPDTLTPPEAIPEPERAGRITELKPAPNWLVNYVDKFGMSEPLDAWTKSTLGYEVLPEQLDTTKQLKLSQTQQAGGERLLQRNFFDPIVEAAGNLGVDMGDFGTFLWARGAADRNRIVAEQSADFPEGGSGLTTAQAAELLQQFKAEGTLPKLNQLARQVDKLVDFTLQEKVKAGLLSEEDAKGLRAAQPYYVPLKGFAAEGDMMTADVEEDAHGEQRRTEALRALRTAVPTGSITEYRKAFGRESMPFHPLFNLFQDAEQAVRRSVTNKAGLPILRAWKANPSAFEGILNVYTDKNAKKVLKGRDIPGGRYEPVFDMKREYYSNPGKYLLVKDKGVAHYIEFAEAGVGSEIKRMFANMTPKDMQGAMKQIANVNNFLKGMLTYKNPLYLLTVAPFRDISDAVATAALNQNVKGGPAFQKNLASKTFFYAINPSTWSTLGRFVFGKGVMNDPTGKLLEEMIKGGGATLHTRFLNVQEKADVAARAIKELQGVEGLTPKERGAKMLEGLNRWIDGLADVMDMVGRFATYRAASDLGIPSSDAAALALDSSLNLTRRGEMARGLDLVVPFFGAAVEGSRKTLRVMSTPRAAVKIIGALMAYGVLESMWNAWWSVDSDDDGEEDYLDLDRGAGLRMSRAVLYYGDGADDYIKVPIGQMLGYFKFVGNKIGDVMAGNSSTAEASVQMTDAMKELSLGLVSLLSPARIPGTDIPSVVTAFTPLVGKPLIENAFNKNFFGSPVYQEAYPGGAPRAELGRASTGELWKDLAKMVNSITGGSEAVSGKFDFQPEVYRHIIEGYFGGPYQLAKQTVGLKDAEGVADVPGIKSFVGTGSEYAPQSKYFENTAVVRQIMGRLNKLEPEQQAAQGEKYFRDTDPAVIEAYQLVERNLDLLNKQQKALLAEAETAEDKQMVLDYFLAEKNKYYSAFNAVYNDTKRAP